MVNLLLPSGRGLEQEPGARELLCGKGVLRFELGDIGLVEIDLRLERRLFEQVEEVALFTSAPSTNSRFSRKAVTRATSDTRPIDWMRPTNSFDCVICWCATRTTPTAGGPFGAGLSFRLKRERCEEEGHQEMPNDYLYAAL